MGADEYLERLCEQRNFLKFNPSRFNEKMEIWVKNLPDLIAEVEAVGAIGCSFEAVEAAEAADDTAEVVGTFNLLLPAPV